MVDLVATAVWRLSPALVAALDERLGPPVDSYVNGSQVWLSEDGPGGATLEWRLHPVGAYQPPSGCSPYDLWESVVTLLAQGTDPAALLLGEETRPLTSLWDGLECFPPFGDELEPATLTAAVTDVLGLPPDRAGLADHQAVGDAWERSEGRASIVALLLEQLAG